MATINSDRLDNTLNVFLGSWFRVSLIIDFFVQPDNTVYFDVCICTLHVSGVYHSSSGASLQIGP
jgi:hypothetical protein